MERTRTVCVSVPSGLHLRIRQYSLLHGLNLRVIVTSLFEQLLESDQGPPDGPNGNGASGARDRRRLDAHR
jgi:hypothetical protein